MLPNVVDDDATPYGFRNCCYVEEGHIHIVQAICFSSKVANDAKVYRIMSDNMK